ncbi:MAG: ribosome hibernation-promoting factor, HPF/YfiA family [Acidimicrobiia bacterium]
MEVIVQGRNVVLSEDERVSVRERVEHAGRVFEQAVDTVDVEVFEEANPRQAHERCRVEMTVSVSGRVLRVESAADTRDTALDEALDRLTRRIRRFKEKLIDRSRRPEPTSTETVAVESDEIVRVKQFIMKPMTIEEASLQMEMLGHSFFFFHNASTDLQSVLYRRRDGRLGLIEPS